jgi:GMP synthase (glutamine-hydrolysing)
MTANAVALPEAAIKRMTDRILKLKGIDAVFLDLTSKPPGTIEWE